MTELSYFWGGTSVGDATLAPYDDDEFSDFIAALLQTDRTVQGVIFGIDNSLVVTNPSGLTIRIATGIALVDGKLYKTDANVDLTLSAAPGASTDYYHVILRKSFAAQTVRAVLVGPVNGGPATPAVQNDGTTWELVLAEVRQTSAGVITIYDKRIPVNPNRNIIERQLITTAAGVTDSVAFTDIPTCYRKLILDGWIVPLNSGTPSTDGVDVTLNSDTTGTSYSWLINTLTSAGISNSNDASDGKARMGVIGQNKSGGTSNLLVLIHIEITQDLFANGLVSLESRIKVNDTTAGDPVTQIGSANWFNAGPVTRIDLITTGVAWDPGSVWTLYGIP